MRRHYVCTHVKFIAFDSSVTYFSLGYEKMKSQLHCRYARKRSSASDNQSIPRKTAKRLAPSSKAFALLLSDLIIILKGDPNAVETMKVVLKSMTLPFRDEDGEDELSAVMNSPKFNNATTIVELFDALAPCWNEFDCDLLDTLVRASASEAAIQKLEKFLEGRDPDMPLVVRTAQLRTAEQPVVPDLAARESATSSQSTVTPDESSAVPKQSADPIQQYVLLPNNSSHQSLVPVGAAVILVRIDGEQVTAARMLDIKEASCHNLRLPKEATVYVKSQPGSITLIFYISIKLIQYLRAQVLELHELYSLRRRGVFEIIIPDQYHLIIPPLEVR